MTGSYWFVDADTMTGGQLLWAFASYGYVISAACNLISDGSELLLLIPQLAGLVGCVVLPVLGAVPDGMIVLFSGLDPDLQKAQETIAVGIGSQAGSTIMLLTIPWFFAAWAGRVDVKNGQCNYKPPKGEPKLSCSCALLGSGVQPGTQIRTNAVIMLVTAMTYFAVQVPALYADDMQSTDNVAEIKAESKKENRFVLFGFVLCVCEFIGYMYIQYKVSRPKDGAEKRLPKDGLGIASLEYTYTRQISETTAELVDGHGLALFIDQFRKAQQLDNERASANSALLDKVSLSDYLKGVLARFYLRYKTSSKGINFDGFKRLLEDVNLQCTDAEAKRRFDEADRSGMMQSNHGNGYIDLEEFFECFKLLAATPKSHFTPKGGDSANGDLLSSAEEQDDDDEEEEMPQDFKDLEPTEQRRRILFRSAWMMGLGTFLVLVFTDPMVDVLSEMGHKSGIPTFYVSFLLAPLAANASEFVASYNYGAKKTSSSISISLSTLLGAAVMNNTFVLGIFFALIYFKGLAWQFTAETLTILFVELFVFFIVFTKPVMRSLETCVIFALYPLSLTLVYALENFVGLD